MLGRDFRVREMNRTSNVIKRVDGMKRLVALLVVLGLVACSTPPKLPEPSGAWVPVNRPHNVGSNT